jgi:low temperature requirement protein LtrA
MVLTGVLWVAGGLPTTRRGPGLWVVALPLDYTARLHGFSVPGLGRSRTGEWTIEGGHLAERCQLFVIVAPGASPSCSPAPRLPTWTRRRGAVTAFVVAFAGSLGAVVDLLRSRGSARKRCDRGRRRPGPPGTLGHAYFHVPMVAGIIVRPSPMSSRLPIPAATLPPLPRPDPLGGPALHLAQRPVQRPCSHTGRGHGPWRSPSWP